jgi:hypothetical protein
MFHLPITKMNKMKNINIFLLPALLAASLLSCDPAEDRESLGSPIAPADLKYSVSQETNYDNKVFLENLTRGSIPYWEYAIGKSTRDMDTVVFPFAGDYWVKFTAFGRAGAISDSTNITVSKNDINYFADPGWNLLTNGTEGKYWKLVRVTLGPATNYNSVWGDVNWWSADTYNWNDSAYFDLKGNFNYIRYKNGEAIPGNFVFNPKEVLTGTVIPAMGKSITISEGNQMMIRDGSNEMSELNKTHYRIYKLSADTLIVGQGSYYTQSRNVPSEDWSYYHWYVWQK